MLEMSLGLAVFPSDATDGDVLLRKADEVLFQLKAHKHDRSQWWQLASDQSDIKPVIETEIDAYDAEAAAMLAQAQDLFRNSARDFSLAFEQRIASGEEAAPILAGLSTATRERHRRMQGDLMDMLFQPSTTRVAIQSRAVRLGEIHALVGVDAAMLSRAMALYREGLTDHFNQTLLSAQQRYRLLLVAERRLQDYLEGELRSMQHISSAYLDALSVPLPESRTLWVDSLRSELEAMGNLPGMAAALLLRLNADGIFTVEHSAGPAAEKTELLLQEPDAQAQLMQDAGASPGATVQAWRDGQIITVRNFSDDPRRSTWRDMARTVGVRSMLAVPVLDAEGHVAGGVCLFGQHPGQFESAAMHQFAQSVGQRWEELWRRAALPASAAAIPHDLARTYRERLFSGGLKMFVQPVVDLRSGSLVRVEALARLIQPDGRILSPADFLPLLGDAELARLFRQGLDQALGYLPIWSAQGIDLETSVNLPPSTLLLPECDRWVADALAQHDIAPGRLTLELLETTLIDEAARDAAIARLTAMGVNLAIDDLGAGYSSLRRLSTLPCQTIKIDQGLLRRLRDEPKLTLAVMDALIEMGRRLGRDVVVEGLESRGMIEVASLLGATYGQGYGLARPMPAEDLLSWSRRFRLSVEPGHAHTYLGALAQHWKYGHALPLEKCPVTAFFQEKKLAATQAAHWHAEAHTNEANDAVNDALTAWFMKRMHMQQAGDD